MIMNCRGLDPSKSVSVLLALKRQAGKKRDLAHKVCPATRVALFRCLYYNEKNRVARFPGSSTVEHSAVNRRVASSNLARGANFLLENKWLAEVLKSVIAAFWCRVSVKCPCSLMAF